MKTTLLNLDYRITCLIIQETILAKDLFHACNKYGHVVDSFIPLKRSKEGKRFGFVKFINVSNVERLVGNLCTTCWIAIDGLPRVLVNNIAHSKIVLLWGTLTPVICSSVGLSGGILCVWDPISFAKDNATIFDYLVAVRGTWLSTTTKVMFVSIYAPQDISKKKSLWEYITHIIDTWDGECIILGDFNEVRSKQERFRTIFNETSANAFNHFISTAGLIDLPLEGYSFTWAIKSDKKMSKLDSSNDSNKIILLKKKLQALKASIKEWCKDDIKRSNDTCFSIKARLSDLDKLFSIMALAMRDLLHGKDFLVFKDLHNQLQKSHFRLGVRKQRCSHNVRLIDNLGKVKNEFLKHFANRDLESFCPIIRHWQTDRANILTIVPNLIGVFLLFRTPFSYLGVKVGMSPSRRKAWDEIIGKVSNRLSKWKIKTLSVGGRLTLIKYVLTSLPLYHMSLYKAPLGVSS
ncbi:RNA-directed DNA polymerase, eukaryota [Tanacetum coccineum]